MPPLFPRFLGIHLLMERPDIMTGKDKIRPQKIYVYMVVVVDKGRKYPHILLESSTTHVGNYLKTQDLRYEASRLPRLLYELNHKPKCHSSATNKLPS